MTDKEAKQLDNIDSNQRENSNYGLITELLLHLIDKDSSLSADFKFLKEGIDAKISAANSKTEVQLIKWIAGTDIALAGVIIAAIHYLN